MNSFPHPLAYFVDSSVSWLVRAPYVEAIKSLQPLATSPASISFNSSHRTATGKPIFLASLDISLPFSAVPAFRP